MAVTSDSGPFYLADFELYCKQHLPEIWWNYSRFGAGAEQSLRENQLAFERNRLRPRLLHDVSKRDMSTTVFGHRIEFPVMVSPTAFHGAIHPDGEIATAKGAASIGSAMVLSMWANKSIEEVAASVPVGTLLFQQVNFVRNLKKEEPYTLSLVRRAEKAGFKGLVVTVDQPVMGLRKYDITITNNECASHLRLPQAQVPGGAPYVRSDVAMDPSVTWDDITWLRNITDLPIMLKGILTAKDAREAVRRGVAGILVSNHGGRQIDGVPATIDALQEVVNAVQGSNVEVYLDGGIRWGTDVLKALALGARAVFIGRPALWGLTYDGAEGVKKVLAILRREFDKAMALCGCSSLAEITPDLISIPPNSKL